MPRYNYIAKSFSGEPHVGVLEAKDEHDIAKILRSEGYILISATTGETSKKSKFSFSIPLLNRVSLVEKMMFTRNLKIMIKAGISLPRALRILSEQTKSKKFKKALLEVEQEITKGKNFSDSLSKYPNIFSELFFSMVKVGEESGTLEEVLEILTKQMERDHELKSKIMGAMIYPAVIVSAMIIIGIIMMILVVPKLAQTFAELDMDLPLTTRFVIASGMFLANFWYLLPLIFLSLVVAFRMAIKTTPGKLFFGKVVLKIPIISPLVKKVNTAYTARTLSSLISSGVPIVRSLEIVANVLGNIYYKQAINDAAEQVKKGEKLAKILEKYSKIYPTLIIQMLAVGEETGETSNILEKLADFYEDEVTNATKNLSSLIEPILMIIIGTAVGFFAVSMIQPIYSMMGAIK